MDVLLQDLLAEVNADKLMEYTAKISAEVRYSGSEEELRSFQYMERQMQSFGLATQLNFTDAYISIPLSASLRLGGRELDCLTASMAASTPGEGVELELLYIGDFKDFAQYQERVADKALIFHGFTDRAAVQATYNAGGAACIFINGERLHYMIASPVWGNPTAETFRLIPSIYVLSVTKYDGPALIEAAARGEKVYINTQVENGWRKIPTLAVEKTGELEPGKFVMFSGHVDSWYQGAMDNGTANATMLEVARVLAAVPLRRSLRILFWSGHSHGRYAGSTSYLDQHFGDIYHNCLVHVNIDSVGAKGATILTEGNIMPLTKRLSVRLIKELAGQEFTGRAMGRGGDHSFWGAGVPSAFMAFSGQPYPEHLSDLDTQYMIKQFNNGPQSCGFGWWWHSAEDTLDKIDPDNLSRDARIYLAHIYHYCNDPIFPLDLNAGVAELSSCLDTYRAQADGHISLKPLKYALDELADTAAYLEELKESALNEEMLRRINEAGMRIARTVVRLGYVGLSEFDPDVAMNVLRWPLLAGLNRLAALQHNPHDYKMLLTEIQRRINQCEFILKESVRSAWTCLQQPGEFYGNL